MGFKCAIVGLPNVGKSTLFNALTNAQIEAANYPFCTIEPNVGIVPVPDQRLDQLAQLVNPEKCIPATMEFVDIAGLVEGAANGEGLGNQFLAHIRETDAIALVVRCFDDDNIIHVNGKVDPLHDIDIIHTELALADMATVDKALQRISKNAKSGNKDAVAEQETIKKIKHHLDQGLAIRILQLNDQEKAVLKSLHLLTAKPILYIANISDADDGKNAYVDKVHAHAAQENAGVVTLCVKLEAELSEMDDADKTDFLAAMDMAESGLDRVIKAGFALLQLQTYFTAGKKEVRAWTIPVGASAPQAAGVIHSDFERGFIRAETIAFEDYITYQGEQGAKEAGKLRQEGKTYIVKDGDVLHFLFNT